jgi:predicted Zn finger-like uncharacterized protein
VIVTCPSCKTRYRVDAKALTTPGGRTVRCAACGLSWHQPPTALETRPLEPAKEKPPPLEPKVAAPLLERAVAAASPPLEPMPAPPPHPEPPRPTPETPAPASARPWASLLAAEETGAGEPPDFDPDEAEPRRRRWLMVGLPVLVVLIVLLAALYLSH